MAVGDGEIEEIQTRSVGRNKMPLKDRTQSPGRYLLSPNNDSFERHQARLARAAASQRRRSLAFPDEPAETPAAAAEKPRVLDNAQVQELLNNCIKLAAENKITQQNTWDLQLIDYLPAIIKADNEQDMQTNFQKASCTLEASAKIYSCRVDSVHSETYKVLGGLNRSAAPGKDTPAEDGAELQADEQQEQDVRRKDHQKKMPETLEDNYENLNVKHFEVNLNVDPLFHQTSAQFDEGGAKGLLLNTLSVYRGCEILFDSCDVPEKSMKLDLPSDPSGIDLSFMADTIHELLTSRERDISPSLKDIVDMLDDPLRQAAASASEAEENKFQDDETPWFSNDPEEADDDMGEVSFQDDSSFQNDPDNEYWEASKTPATTVKEATATEWLEATLLTGMAADWAGPEHWKFMKPRGRQLNFTEKCEKETKRKKKEPFSLDYTSVPEFDMALLARPRDLRADLLPQSRQPVTTTLPEDSHFQPVDLLRLFLRPSVIRRGSRSDARDQAHSMHIPEDAFPDHDDGDFGDGGGYEDFGEPEDNLDTLVVQPRKVQKIEVNYDKTSKQVDVRLLKKSIWEHLQEAADPAPECEHRDEQEQVIQFSNIFSRVPSSCSAAAPEDISVHLCFICLLHLANEHNLVIQGCSSMDELLIRNVQQ